MSFRASLLMLLFAASFAAIPVAVHAAATPTQSSYSIPFFGPIIPNVTETVAEKPSNQNVCAAGWGMLMTVINNIIRLLLTIAIVFVAPLLIAYAGFLFVVNPVSPEGVGQAKKILTNTVVGIIVALAAWLIVDAFMAVLYNAGAKNGTTTLDVWSNLITSGGADNCLPQKGTEPNAQPTARPGITAVPPTTNCAASYAATLPGITVSSTGNCCDKTIATCTSLDGMLQSTIDQIMNVKNKCGGVTVTGGTEVGHEKEGTVGSHSGGSKVDISQNLIACIERTGVTKESRPTFGKSQIKDKCGNIYTWEVSPDHTDIYVLKACPL